MAGQAKLHTVNNARFTVAVARRGAPQPSSCSRVGWHDGIWCAGGGGGGVGTVSARAARRCVVHGSAARDGRKREGGEGPCKIARYCQKHSAGGESQFAK